MTEELEAAFIAGWEAYVDQQSPNGNTVVVEDAWKGYHATLPPPKPSPLLQCVECKNTESPAGAMARHFNHGRCVHCGGFFKVIRA